MRRGRAEKRIFFTAPRGCYDQAISGVNRPVDDVTLKGNDTNLSLSAALLCPMMESRKKLPRSRPEHLMATEAIRPAAHRQPWYTILYLQVLIAIALGILIGYFYPDLGKEL